MATSGNFLTSDSGQGGGNYYGRLIYEWWRTGNGISGSVGYHHYSFVLKTYGGASNYWQYCYQASMNTDGQGYSAGTIQAYGAGATTLLSGSKTAYTNSAGNRSFSASAQAGIYYNSINTSGSGSWSFPNVPLLPVISSSTGNINDESNPISLSFSNPPGGATTGYLYAKKTTEGTWVTVATRSNYGSGVNFNLTETERDKIRDRLHNVTSGNFKYRVGNSVGYVDTDKTVSIVNANPTFTTATYRDANSTTSAITGDDQYLIQGYSQLEAKILQADKAVALKGSSMVEYNHKIGSIDTDVAYVDALIETNLGTLGINANADLVIKAIDTRGLTKSISLPVNVLPYVVPQVTPTAQRVNNFETETDIHIEGVISRLTISGTDKNDVATTDGVQYRYKKTSDGTWGSWTNVASTTSSGNVSTTDFEIDLDRNFAWNMEFKIADELETSTVALIVPVGIPIFRIGLDGFVYNAENRIMVSHIGQVIESTTLTTPAEVEALYGGTWVAFGAGRVTVGLNSGDAEFNSIKETGGAKTHTLTTAQMPSHTHGQYVTANSGSYGIRRDYYSDQNTHKYNQGVQTYASGGGGSHNNIQPYIVVYRYERTA